MGQRGNRVNINERMLDEAINNEIVRGEDSVRNKAVQAIREIINSNKQPEPLVTFQKSVNVNLNINIDSNMNVTHLQQIFDVINSNNI